MRLKTLPRNKRGEIFLSHKWGSEEVLEPVKIKEERKRRGRKYDKTMRKAEGRSRFFKHRVDT